MEHLNFTPPSWNLARWLSGKEFACHCRRHRRHRFDPWVVKTPWRRDGNPLQYSCLGNLMDRGAWWATGCKESHRSECTHSPGTSPTSQPVLSFSEPSPQWAWEDQGRHLNSQLKACIDSKDALLWRCQIPLTSWGIWDKTWRRNWPGWPKMRILWPSNVYVRSGAGSALFEVQLQGKPSEPSILVTNKQARSSPSHRQFITDFVKRGRWEK